MELHWIERESSAQLVIFVLGWAADYRSVDHILPKGCDVAAIYDYRDMRPPDMEQLNGYARTYLFAWSFGVWVCEQIFGGMKFHRAIAFNGTPLPMDGRYGLDPRRAAATLRGLRQGGMEPFNRRTYGELYDQMKDVVSPRPTEDNIAELERLMELSAIDYAPQVNWSKAVVGASDLIFPPENMIAFWQERAEVLSLPHYPFHDPELILKEIDY